LGSPSVSTSGTAGFSTADEAQVRSRLMSQGFGNVTNLQSSANGGWTASATRGGANLNLSVDAAGNVRAH